MEGNSELQEVKIQKQVQKQSQNMIHERLRPENQDLPFMDSAIINRENDIRNSELAIKIVFNKHGSKEETKGLEKMYENADVIIPENFGWTQKYLDHLRMLSDGKITPVELLDLMGTEDPIEYARDKNLFELIHGKGKVIDFIDLPYDNDLWKQIDENKFPKIQFGPDFVQTLESVREYNEKFASMQLERERYMIEHMQELAQNLKNIHPELKNKQNINVLMYIGAGHERFPDKLRNHFQSVKESSTTPRVYLYSEEAARKQMNGNQVDDELLINVLAERVLSYDKNKTFTTDDPVKDAKLIREIVSRFASNELRNMFEDASDLTEWAVLFKQGLKERVKVPAAVK